MEVSVLRPALQFRPRDDSADIFEVHCESCRLATQYLQVEIDTIEDCVDSDIQADVSPLGRTVVSEMQVGQALEVPWAAADRMVSGRVAQSLLSIKPRGKASSFEAILVTPCFEKEYSILHYRDELANATR